MINLDNLFSSVRNRVFMSRDESRTQHVAWANLVYLTDLMEIDKNSNLIVPSDLVTPVRKTLHIVRQHMVHQPLMECWFDDAIVVGMPRYVEVDGSDADDSEIWWYVGSVYRAVRAAGIWMH